MYRIFTLTAAVALMTPAAVYADAAVQAPVLTMVAAFNKGDVALAKSTHVAAPSILDEVTAPYIWTGAGAFDGWIGALGKTEATLGRTDGLVAVGPVTRETVMGDHAYLIFPSTYDFKQAGKAMRETGSMTFALIKQGAAWKIAAWSWSSPAAVPVG